MQVFVTGASGLVGSFVVKHLLQENHQVKALIRQGRSLGMANEFANDVDWVEGDLDDLPLLVKEMAGCNAIIHAAALVSFDPADHDKIFRVNLEGTKNMLNAAIVQKEQPVFCLISSVAALAIKPGKTIINESALADAETQFSPYGKSKFLAELELFRAEAEGLSVFAVNPSMVLGPGYIGEGSTALLSYAQSRKLFSPTGQINYVDVRDVAKIVVLLLGKPGAWGQRYITCAGSLPYPSFFEKVAKLSKTKPPTILLGPFLGGVAWRFMAFISFLLRKKPLITRLSVMASLRRVSYQSKNMPEMFPGFIFKELSETLEWALPLLRKRK